MNNLVWISFSLFLLMDSIGNIPLYLAVLKEIPYKRKQQIILREMIIALVVMLLFNFLGEKILQFLHLTQASIRIAGGIILFLISLKMVFPSQKEKTDYGTPGSEPYIVPLAIPLIAGPAILAAIILYASQENPLTMIVAILIAWSLSLIILLATPFLGKKMGAKGIMACEKLMGLILVLIAIQMFLEGITLYLATLPKP
ncbi:MAG: MarC family protein [Chlamydiota bacterium]